MSYPQVQFVAAPEDGAEVLFDFNDNFGDAPSAIVHGSFNLGVPSVEGDPDGLGVQYGPREASFSLLIYGNRHAAMQTQALLARTFMLRRRGWLRVQLDEFIKPVWLRTYTPTPSELDFSLIAPTSEVDAWRLEVAVAAEPFVRGERIVLWTGVIDNNPASGTNPLGVNLPAVVGDAPAPLRIGAEFNRIHNQSDILWATSAVPSGFAPIVWPIGTGDGWSIGSDTSDPQSHPAFSGGTCRKVSFASGDAMATRLAGTAPASIPPGTYRVFLRMARDNVAGTFAFRLGYRTQYQGDQFGGSKVAVMDRGPSTNAIHATYVDLGEFSFPTHRATIDIAEAANNPVIALQVERLSGISGALLDCFVLVPVDHSGVTTLEPWEKSDILVSEFPGQGPQFAAGEAQLWDGDAETSARITPAGQIDAYVRPANRGRFPTVRPGVTNRLTLIQQTRLSSGNHGTEDNTDLITDTATITVSYQPRHLWLGEG